jgi:hypothetical protein
MNPMHPELRKGLAEEHVRRLAEDMQAAPMSLGAVWRLVARVPLGAFRRRQAGHAQASSASLTSLSASSLCSRRTAVYMTDPSLRASREASRKSA